MHTLTPPKRSWRGFATVVLWNKTSGTHTIGVECMIRSWSHLIFQYSKSLPEKMVFSHIQRGERSVSNLWYQILCVFVLGCVCLCVALWGEFMHSIGFSCCQQCSPTSRFHLLCPTRTLVTSCKPVVKWDTTWPANPKHFCCNDLVAFCKLVVLMRLFYEASRSRTFEKGKKI